jgi:hypothetical protein
MKKLLFAFLGLLFISNISLGQNIHGFNFLSSYTYEEIKSKIERNFYEKKYEINDDYSGYKVEVKLNELDEYEIIVFLFKEDKYDSSKFILTRTYCSNATHQFAESLYNEVRSRYNTPPSKGYIEESQNKGLYDIPVGKSFKHEMIYNNRLKDGDGVLVRYDNSIYAQKTVYHFEISYSSNASLLGYCEPLSKSPYYPDWKIIKTF